MTDGKKKREKIFNIYRDHLRLLVNEGIVKPQANNTEYICPICLTEFKSVDECDNPLTLEDAPPKSLGGTADILTCKKM